MHGRSRIEALETRVCLAATTDDVIPIRNIGGWDIATIEWQGQQQDVFAGRWMVALDGYAGRSFAQQQSLATRAVRETDAAFNVTMFIADGVFLVTAPKQMQPAEVGSRLARVPGFRHVTPDFRYEADLTPNDQFFNQMWGLNQGNDIDIDAP